MFISVKELSKGFENTNKDPAAYLLARDIERLADIVDPFEYSNVVSDIYGGDIEKSINALYNDIVSGKAGYIARWLDELITDPGTDPRDKERAENRLARYKEYNTKRGF